jgi:hypothetical protein
MQRNTPAGLVEEEKWAKDSLSISPVRHRGGDGLDTESNLTLGTRERLRQRGEIGAPGYFSRREESKGEHDGGSSSGG